MRNRMALFVRPLQPQHFAAEITGIDLPTDPDGGAVASVRAAMDRYAVCVFPHETPLSDDEHARFSRALGPLMDVHRKPVFKVADGQKMEQPRITTPGVLDVSNLDADGNILPP